MKTNNLFSNVEIETITACNLRCSYCPNSKFDRSLIKNSKVMKKKLFYQLIDQLSELRFEGKIYPHFYGEPLLDKRLPFLVKYIKKKLPNTKVIIYSNGELLTTNLYKILVEAGVNKFRITKHFSKKSTNIKNIINYRKKNKDNVILDYYEIDKTNLFNRGGIIKIKKEVSMKECSRPSTNLMIDHRGNVIICCNDYFSTVQFGNIKNEKLIDIWNKKYFKKIRCNLKKGIFDLDICKRCGIGSLFESRYINKINKYIYYLKNNLNKY